MADLRDEHGNRIQLTDELGNPVTLTDERGNPMHLTGIATTHPPDVVDVQEVTITSGMAAGGGSMFAAKPTGGLEEEVQVPVPVPGGPAGIGQDVGLGHQDVGMRSSGPEIGLGQGHDVEKPRESLLVREERHQPLGEVVKRSNSTSSSSSSSEDDGEGGRRKKKGLKEKLKEKLTIGGGKHSKPEEQRHPDTPPVEHHEKKSMMEKIKEKLPGGHHNH